MTSTIVLGLVTLIATFVLIALWISQTKSSGDQVGLKERLAALATHSQFGDDPSAPKRSVKRDELVGPKIDFKKMLTRFAGEDYNLKVEQSLAQADIPMRVSEFLMLRVFIVAFGFMLARQIATQWWIAVGIGAALCMAHLPILGIKRALRISRFVNQLAEFLSLISNSLRAGQTFMQGVDMACKETPPPISVEFKQLLRETNLGMPIEESFNNMYQRVPSEDLKIVLSAFTIQRQVGGNLAEILDQVSRTIRERIKIQGQIKVLTTQGKLSGMIVGLMPFGLTILLSFTSHSYIKNLWETTVGHWMIGFAIFLQLTGCFVIYKICDIEV